MVSASDFNIYAGINSLTMASPAITSAYLSSISKLKFSGSSDINNYFISKTGQPFIKWFNSAIALKEFWGKTESRSGIKISDTPETANRFNQLWDQIPVLFGATQINLLQFICLMSIINNETGGKIIPATELIGNKLNPGLSYAFNKIPGLKRSYNTLTSNRTAYDLFNDANYQNAHKDLALSASLKNTKNAEWKGEVYPKSTDTSTDPLRTGFIQEADFYKFRGRGFIQTTTRGNYMRIINFIINYNGSDPLISNYKKKWKDKDRDVIATISANNDWDRLFQETNFIIPAAAISLHSQFSGNYLNKIVTEIGVDANIKQMGKAISGSNDYATVFYNRVLQIANALGN